ncbi:MAG TPA: sensor domain-containing protein [Mycobacterium sp.]|nr:sensor domain-containing protein [Mycobacterium sp.]
MRRWTVAVGCGALALAAAGCVQTVGGTAQPAQTSGPGLGGILLTANDINAIMGVNDIAVVDTSRDMQSAGRHISRPECLGALYNAEDSVYQGSGWIDVFDQVLADPVDDHWVEQTAVRFAGQNPAQAFVATSLSAWSRCSGKEVSVTSGGDNDHWDIGDLIITGQIINQTAQQRDAGGWGCQHALSAIAAIVIEVTACATTIGDEAVGIVDKMAGKLS